MTVSPTGMSPTAERSGNWPTGESQRRVSSATALQLARPDMTRSNCPGWSSSARTYDARWSATTSCGPVALLTSERESRWHSSCRSRGSPSNSQTTRIGSG